MKKTVISIAVAIVLLLSTGILCSCGTTTCEVCGGSGEVTCPECDGSGEIEDEAPCFSCGGTGVNVYGTCVICEGDGHEDELCMKCGGLGTITCEKCEGYGEY